MVEEKVIGHAIVIQYSWITMAISSADRTKSEIHNNERREIRRSRALLEARVES